MKFRIFALLFESNIERFIIADFIEEKYLTLKTQCRTLIKIPRNISTKKVCVKA